MEWTKNMPTQRGYYWLFDDDSEEPELVKVTKEICHYDTGLEIIRMGSDVHDSISLGHYAEEKVCSMLWFGPIDLAAPEGWKSQAAA
ncbi:MAG: hypothetical protein AAGU11_01760 [Syntrophobacteraceae bacterium]